MQRRCVVVPEYARGALSSAEIGSGNAAPVEAAADLSTLESESTAKTIFYPDQEVQIFSTKRRWRGVDVYLAPQNLVAGDVVLTVRVFALIGNLRVLVASGRLRPPVDNEPVAFGVSPAQWVAAARCGASQFVVTLQATSAAPIPQDAQVAIAAYASDALIEPPYGVGSMWFQSSGQLPAPPGQPIIATDLQLVPDAKFLGFVATQALAVAPQLWVLLYDQDADPAIGDPAKISWPFEGAAGTPGAGVHIQKLDFRQQSDVLSLVISSHGRIYSPVGVGGSTISVLVQ